MFGWAIGFLIFGVATGALGFGLVSGTAFAAAKFLFKAALLAFLVWGVLGVTRRGGP
jgi:uncharacterized membrane protein YtjA (UPF0391 family)